MKFWKRREEQGAGEPAGRPDAGAGAAVDEEAGAVEAGAGGERFCSVEAHAFPLSDELYVVYSVADQKSHLLLRKPAQLLQRCRTFKSMDEHAAASDPVFELRQSRVGTRNTRWRGRQTWEQFALLAERGLLLSEGRLLEGCRRAAAASPPPPPIGTVGVVTRDRPAALARCLESFASNFRAHGRAPELLVTDDSADAANVEAGREALRLVGRRHGLACAYAGAEEKRRFAAALVGRGGLPPEAVEFALYDPEGYGLAPGANRNAQLLQTAGSLVLSADDDVVCKLVAPPDDDDDAASPDEAQSAERMELWFFPDRETAVARAKFVEEDILGLHEQMLGRDVASCVARYDDLDVLNFEQLSPRALRLIEAGGGKVSLTFNGTVGDSGLRVPVVYEVLGRETRARMLESEAVYRSARDGREVWRLVADPLIGRRTWFLSTAFAYDHRTTLPPFLPVARGEDGVFANTLRACSDEAFFGDLPRAVLHLPAETRAYTPEQIRETALNVSTSTLLTACVLSFQPGPAAADGATRLRALGQYLSETGKMSLPDFEEFARIHVWQLQSRYISALEEELQLQEDAPDFWVGDVEAYLGELRQALRRPDYIIPYDVPAAGDADEARRRSQRLVRRFGELLRVWPDMVEAAGRLRAEGVGLTVPA